MKYYLLLFLFISFISDLSAQIIPSINFSVKDGLPGNSIRTIFKDSRNILWLGTDSGLASFDGIEFKTYNNVEGYRFSEVWSITEDNHHNLWIAFYGDGVAKFNGKVFEFYSVEKGLASNFIRKIHYSKKFDCIITASEKGVSYKKSNKSNFKTINESIKFLTQFMGIDENKENLYVTSGRIGAYQFNYNQKKDLGTLKKLKSPRNIYSSFIDNDYHLRGLGSYALNIYDLKNKNENTIALKSIPWSIVKDNNKTYYLSTWDVHNPKGAVYALKDGSVSIFSQLANLPENGYWCSYFDKNENQLWLGSVNKGLFSVNLDKNIHLYTPTFFSIPKFSINEMFYDNLHRLWLGGENNISILKNDNSFINLTKENLEQKLIKYYGLKQIKTLDLERLHNGFKCFNFHSDNKGNVWVNTTFGTFCFSDKLELLFHQHSIGGHSIFDNQNNLYFGRTYSTIIKISELNNWQNSFSYSLKDVNTPKDITKVKKDGDLAWFGTNYTGLYILKDGKFTSLYNKGIFKEKEIVDIQIIYKHKLLVTTKSGKVYTILYKNNKFKILNTLSTQSEIIGTSISFALYYKNTYYIGTDKGLNIIKNGKFIKLINESNGIKEIHFNNAIIDVVNDRIRIGTNNGLLDFNLINYQIKNSNENLGIKINDFRINGVKKLNSNWGEYNLSSLELNYLQNDLEIVFGSNNITYSKNNLFRYKTLGLSKKWSEYESIGHINLLGLNPGNYTIIIEGKNLNTGSLIPSKEIKIEIVPPIWKRNWFIITSTLLSLLVAFSFVRWRILKIERAKQEKLILINQLTETKLEALRAQMNPHFTFNAINSIQNFIMDADTENALMYLGAFSKLIRQTLETASEKLVSVHQEIDFLESYILVQQMRFEKVQVKWEIDTSINLFKTKIPPLILQPFIENVFEHAFDNTHDKIQELDIIFEASSNVLTCVIKDNGIGLEEKKANRLHQSKGLKLTKERLQLLNKEHNTNLFNFELKDLKSKDNSTSGTEVKVCFLLILD